MLVEVSRVYLLQKAIFIHHILITISFLLLLSYFSYLQSYVFHVCINVCAFTFTAHYFYFHNINYRIKVNFQFFIQS